jgi:hypothetical protein
VVDKLKQFQSHRQHVDQHGAITGSHVPTSKFVFDVWLPIIFVTLPCLQLSGQVLEGLRRWYSLVTGRTAPPGRKTCLEHAAYAGD